MIELLVRRRWLALALLGLALGAVSPGAKTAAVPDNALSVWFLETDPELQRYYAFQDSFGNDEVVLLLVEPPGGALSPGGLAQLDALSQELESIDGVRKVHSLRTVRDAWRTEDEEGRGTVHFAPAIEGGLERLRQNPLIRDRLISADGKSAMLWVEMDARGDFDARRDTIITGVQENADGVLGAIPHALGGIGVIYSGLNLITQHDFGLFVALGYLLLFSAMGWFLRSWRLVVATSGVVTAGTLAALGCYGLAGHQLNMVTVVLPTLIIVLGLADVVHFPAAFVRIRRERPDTSPEEQTVAALREVFLPCLMTTVTTMAGFLALVSSPMAVIRHLGTFAAIGVGTALLASVVAMAAVLPSLPPNWSMPDQAPLQGLIRTIQGALLRRRPALIVGTTALVGLSLWGASLVVTDTYTIGYLPDDHRVVRDHHFIEERWGNYSVLDFLLEPTDGRAIDSPEMLAAGERFVREAEAIEGIRTGAGLHSVHRRLADVLGAAIPADEPLPPDLVAQLRLLLEIQGFSWDRNDEDYSANVLAPWRTEDGNLGRLTLVGGMVSAVQLDTLLQQLQALADTAFEGIGTLRPAGYPPLYTRIVDYAMTSQIRGFFLALAIIFILMLLWLRSPRLALISLVPNVIPVGVMMGLMGVLGIHLDIATATVGAIVIGVSIDDTVHFLLHWREAERKGLAWEEAVAHTFDHAALPAVLTTVLLVIGYPVLLLAEVKTVIAFGLLTTVAAVAALFADLVVLPLLLRAFPARNAP